MDMKPASKMKHAVVMWAAALLAISVACRAEMIVQPLKFEVFPAEVNLETAVDVQTIVARVTQPDGVTRDVTGDVKIELSDPKLAKIEGHLLSPASDGAGTIKVTYHDQTIT